MRDMATGYMYRKVGIGMGGYVLYSTVPRHGPGVGMGKARVRSEKRGKRERRTRQSTADKTGLAIRTAATVRVHKARQNPNVRNEQ